MHISRYIKWILHLCSIGEHYYPNMCVMGGIACATSRFQHIITEKKCIFFYTSVNCLLLTCSCNANTVELYLLKLAAQLQLIKANRSLMWSTGVQKVIVNNSKQANCC